MSYARSTDSLRQRFFKYLCIAAKVPETIRVAKKALEEGKVS